MADLVVIGYPDPAIAEQVRERLLGLQKEYLVDLGDAVVATKDEQGRISLNQLVSLAAPAAASGGLWGALIGLLFLHPLLGAAVGAAAGAISGALTDIGIEDSFMKEVAQVLQPGQAALFVLVRRVTADRVLPELAPFGGTVLRTSLTEDREHALRDALGRVHAAVHAGAQDGAGTSDSGMKETAGARTGG